MIAVDTSALVAIALREPGRDGLLQAILSEPATVGAPILFETFCVLKNRRAGASDARQFCAWVASLPELAVAPFEGEALAWAQIAFERFGKVGGSGAGLNLLDCMSYAVAKAADAALLFTGGDFRKTDVRLHGASRNS